VAEDEFDPIPVLITKNPQGKKERLGKRKELDISSLQNSNVPNVERGGEALTFNERNWGS